MGRVNEYRGIIYQILSQYAEFYSGQEGIESTIVQDDTNGHYMLLDIGWRYPHRIYQVVFHMHLKENKIWIEQDWTREGVASELIAAGVPATSIELGFQSPDMRPFIQWPASSTLTPQSTSV